MAVSKLKTDWLCIGSSGATIDGRHIDPEWLRSMAETYDPALYSALIWPDHYRYFANNMGKVESLRAIDNDNGGVSLYAILAPNDDYIYWNRNGQYLYTSMEITSDFPEKGRFYLSGLGATDSPASACTSEVRFSAEQAGTVIHGESVEIKLNIKPDKPSLLKRVFGGKPKPEDNDMNTQALADLKAQLEALTTQFAAFNQKPGEGKPAGSTDTITLESLAQQVNDLADKFAAREQADASKTAEADKFAQLQADLAKLTEAFNKALKEPDPKGTQPGAHTGDDADLSKYI